MAKDEMSLPYSEYTRMVAREAGAEAARVVMEDHIKLCEARRIVLPDGQRPGMDARVCVLEKTARNATHPASIWRGFWVRVLQTVVATAILAVAAWLLFVYGQIGHK